MDSKITGEQKNEQKTSVMEQHKGLIALSNLDFIV